jgi:uncharacterized membrane protein
LTGWAEYGLAVLLFVVAHAVPPRTTLRARLTGALGERGYLVLYSLLSLLLLYWLLVAAGRAPYVPLWDPAGWQAWIPNLVMPLALVLAVCGTAVANPFSLGGSRRHEFDPARPGITAVSRHPLLLAVALWAIAHMVPNGDLAHALLFGGLAVLAVLGMILLDRRHRRRCGDRRWQALTRKTAFLPGGAPLPAPGDAFPAGRVALALLIWVALLLVHPALFGVSPLPPL